MFNLQRLLHTELGRQFISLLLGIGLAALFRRSCTDKTCITFKGPVISEVDGKTYQFGDKECSQFKLVPVEYDSTKKTVPLATKDDPTQENSDEELKPEPFTIHHTIRPFSSGTVGSSYSL